MSFGPLMWIFREKPPRAVVRTGDVGTLTLEIPPRPEWAMRIIMPLWVLGWVAGEASGLLFVWRGFTSGVWPHAVSEPVPPLAFLCLWLILWTLALPMDLFQWAWNLQGAEVVACDRGEIRLWRRIGGRTFWHRRVSLGSVARVEASGAAWYSLLSRDNSDTTGIGWGRVRVVESSGRIHRFGLGVSDAEAQALSARLQEHLRRFS